MASTSKASEDPGRFLPQRGFGPDVNFDTIAQYHPFLFRVYTPRTLSPLKDDTLFFVGAQFDAKFAPRTPVLSGMHVEDGISLFDTVTYEDCTTHLDWATRSSSPFISTSFSFGWSLWDAVRRYNNGMKHDVEIAIIDARALARQAVTAVQLLRKKPAKEQHKLHCRWYRFAQESQSVLVHGFIPRSAVLASIPLLSIIPNLPSYFLKPSVLRSGGDGGLTPLAWDFADTRRCTYRKFCLDLQARFSRLPFHSRVRDLAVGSARLAIAMLHPWFQAMVLREDPTHFELAITRARQLAGLIAHWPEQTGSRDYAEMQGVIKGLITLIAEEVRSSNLRSSRLREVTASEVERLKAIVVDLEEVVRGQAIVIAQNADRASPNSQTDVSSSPEPESIVQTQPLLVETFKSECPTETSPTSSISPQDRTTTLKLLIPAMTPRSRSQSPSASSSSGSSSLSPVTPSPPSSLHSPTPIKLTSVPHFIHHFDDVLSTSGSSSRRSSRSFALSAPPSPTLEETAPFPSPPLPVRPSSAPPGATKEDPEILPQLIPLPSSPHEPVTPSPLQISIPIPTTVHSSEPITSSSRYFTAVSEEENKFSPFSPFFIIGMDYFPDDDDAGDEISAFASPSPSSSSSTSSSSSIFLSDALSCAVTGFLFGAVLTIYILSSQRRTLLTHLT
ncbi:hypothetical protein E1B28_006421 [Marasmius oreades]|uniref:DUF7587 domain-containing protein n=1 Tax=Marasmius oreades TaxID=181124 RepID=A0A9P7S667_9AGAR|nr:uncharacterized protein E1B28_006421 [Marasmius oreades]KAG7095707.1 hypothetical protein E1B28_006421 [Marasmius oreades]